MHFSKLSMKCHKFGNVKKILFCLNFLIVSKYMSYIKEKSDLNLLLGSTEDWVSACPSYYCAESVY